MNARHEVIVSRIILTTLFKESMLICEHINNSYFLSCFRLKADDEVNTHNRHFIIPHPKLRHPALNTVNHSNSLLRSFVRAVLDAILKTSGHFLLN